MVRKYKRRSFWEILFYTVVLSLICGFSLLNYIESSNLQRSQILTFELYTLRSAILKYTIENKSLPGDLNEAISCMCDVKNNCLNLQINADGDVIDPFGNKYSYFHKNGYVLSSTRDYNNF